MPINHYFNHFESKPEQSLYDDLINETVRMNGIMVDYIPRESESEIDLIFGDDPTKKFDANYPVEMYVQTTEGFEGGDIFSKFGLQVNKQVRLLITLKSFERSVPASVGSRPREGDLVWLKNFRTLFEIKFVEEEYFFYTFGNTKYYGFSLVCETFRYNNEKIETAIDDLDEHINLVATAYAATMNTIAANVGSYISGETVYQGANTATANASGVVISWNLPTGELVLKHTKGIFVPGANVIGANSNTAFKMEDIEVIDNVNSETDNNLELQQEANNVLNFDENNPFGDVDL